MLSFLFLTLSGLRRRLLIGHQILKLLHECIDILEFAIYGSKADICDLIELAERIHHDVADLRGRKLTLRIVADRMFHQINDLFDLGRGYIRLFTGSGDTVTDLGSIEKLTLAILLDDTKRQFFYGLIRRETASAREALTYLWSLSLSYLCFYRMGISYRILLLRVNKKQNQ